MFFHQFYFICVYLQSNCTNQTLEHICSHIQGDSELVLNKILSVKLHGKRNTNVLKQIVIP